MAYLLPRALFVLIAWAMTCILVKHLLPDVEPTIFAVAAVCWAGAGSAYFAYLRKLKRDIDALERNRRAGLGRSPI